MELTSGTSEGCVIASLPLWEDARSLQDILDILDSDEKQSERLPIDDSSHSNDWTTPVIKTGTSLPKRRRQKTNWSQRVKNEIISLRATASELTNELDLLRKRRQKVLNSSNQSARGELHEIGIWKNVAHRQYQARREADVTNETLRQTLAAQRKVAQQMVRILSRGMHKLESCRTRTEVTTREVVELSRCESLLRHLDVMMLQMDSVLLDRDFQSAFGENNISHCNDDGSVTVLSSAWLPFGISVAGNAVWECYTNRANRATQSVGFPFEETTVGTTDMMIKDFRISFGSDFNLGCANGTIAGRRFTREDRDVIIWAADIQSIETGVLPARLTNSRAFGWNIVTRMDRGSEPQSLLQLKHCVRPEQSFRIGILSGSATRMVQELLIGGISKHIEAMLRRVDDVCVGRSNGYDW